MVLLVLMVILKLTKNGNMKCKDANISGKLTNISSISETIGPFTSADLERIKQILINPSIATSSDIEKYDINGSGNIDILDWFFINKAVLAGGTLNMQGSFEINPLSSSKTLKIKNNRYDQPAVQFSLFGAFFRDLNAGNIDVFNSDNSEFIHIDPGSLSGGSENVDFRIGSTSLNDNEAAEIRIFYKKNGEYPSITGYAYPGNAYLELFASNGQTTVGSGGITTPTLTQTSKAENKKNFEKFTLEEAKTILNNTDIYKYNLKTQDDKDKKHIGFVIGDDYNYSEEITSEKNDGANIYSMTSVLYTVVQEQQKQIEKLQERVEKLEGRQEK